MPEQIEGRRRLPVSPAIIVGVLWVVVITILLVRSILKPGSGTVFPIFYTAGGRWLQAENLYQGGTDYLYSPLIAAFFAPFSLLPMWAANLAWRALNIALYLGAVRLWLRRGTSRIPPANEVVVFLLLLPLSIGSLNNAQSNPLLIAIIMGALVAARSGRWALSALCVGLITYLKIYPLAVGLLLVVLFPKKLGWRLAVALVALGALSFVLQKPSYVLEQYRNWAATRSVDERHYDIMNRPRDLWTLLYACGIELNLRLYFLVQILGGAAIAALCVFGRWRQWATDRLLTAVFTLVTSWMLLLGPATESATYIILAPAICLATVEAFSRPFPRWMRTLAVTAVSILIGGAAFIAWAGRRRDLYSMSIQQFGTVLFVIFVIAWLFRDSLWSDSRTADSASPPGLP
ncbi:MAG: glycosyltransferase family 87 protein [Chthoniobacteraceae bacterium]